MAQVDPPIFLGDTGKKGAPLPDSFVLGPGFKVPTRGVPLAHMHRHFYFVTECSAEIINFVRNGLKILKIARAA